MFFNSSNWHQQKYGSKSPNLAFGEEKPCVALGCIPGSPSGSGAPAGGYCLPPMLPVAFPAFPSVRMHPCKVHQSQKTHTRQHWPTWYQFTHTGVGFSHRFCPQTEFPTLSKGWPCTYVDVSLLRGDCTCLLRLHRNWALKFDFHSIKSAFYRFYCRNVFWHWI